MFPANEPVNDELLRKIYECAAVRISYEYDQSSVICIKCIVDVEQFYAFKQRCMESDSLFQKMRLDCNERGLDESEFDNVALPEAEFMEPITNLESPQQYDATRPLDSFIGGTSKLLHVGYNYRIVRVNDETDVLVYRKHRFYKSTKATDWNRWICVANGSDSCPARLTIASKTGFPLALFTKHIRHNHSETVVQMIDSVESRHEEAVQILPSYTLVLDADRRLRLLAEGYRYRLRQAFCGAGKSLWCCVRSDCAACIELSYDDVRMCTAGDLPHSHEVEE
uniref:ZAD domain-containing protein n=1 Tax=Anopheles maculatus TaxID=74869 RepID=A0A182S6E3_9DIPT